MKQKPRFDVLFDVNYVQRQVSPTSRVTSRTLSRTSDTTETRIPCVIKVILFACFTYIDIFLIY